MLTLNGIRILYVTSTILLSLTSSQAFAACTKTGSIKPGDVLLPGDTLCSTNQKNVLACQADGNLVFYIDGKPGFRSNTAGNQNSFRGCFYRENGNFELEGANGKILWSTGTAGQNNSLLAVRDDNMVFMFSDGNINRIYSTECNFRLNSTEGLLPNTMLCSANGQHKLICQADGNLVLYHNGVAGWHSQTHGNAIQGCFMQGDGNLVVYNTSWKPLWHSVTHGNPGAYLTLHDDGQLYLRTPNGTQLRVYR